ncbi:Cytochrome P450 4g15 [Harpegnathos saltator]|uniref:Cytochrome P450 4g15 n=1 Tax=Harpegnathos saltator TaxID=610380 RepID=E2BFW9_HARSA|nr:Cytochrome P450 4g15 [Harpegnathos saltator]
MDHNTTSIMTSYLPNTGCTSLILLVTTLVAFHFYIESRRVVRLALKLPNPPRWPILGHTLITLKVNPKDIISKALELYNKYGTVISAHLGPRAFVFLGDPQDIEIILSSPVHIEKSVEYRFFEPWLGDGLLITKGDKWRKHRKVIAPTFHMSILKRFVPLFYENSLDLVRRLREKVGQQFDCHDYLSAVTVDILTETVMGVRREKRQNVGYDYAMAVMKLSNIVHRRHYDVSLRLDALFKYSKLAKLQEDLLQTVHTLSECVIQEKWKDVERKEQNKTQNNDTEVKQSKATENVQKESSTANYTKLHYARDDLDDIDESDIVEKKRLAFLEMLINMRKNSGQMTDKEIWEEVNTIMFEGHDTIAAGSSFALCTLGSLSEIQVNLFTI